MPVSETVGTFNDHGVDRRTSEVLENFENAMLFNEHRFLAYKGPGVLCTQCVSEANAKFGQEGRSSKKLVRTQVICT